MNYLWYNINTKNKEQQMKTEICVVCPHCDTPLLISKLRCGVFRHGVIKKTNKPIPPHTTKNRCDELLKKKLIYGCGKPFQIKMIQNSNEEQIIDVSVCDYI